ncbi:hypothetical protein [Grimontia sp. SpTr1]|uniref:hypothetical protein n=1 Tax=Grimontia sp. SpTr1 TaxID=2995319 RepID=UPI00248AAF59|nr:hypothetical protein [Grimontia sp. SpTr1]
MEVISHRGYWKTNEEKNSRLAFERSFNLGFGTETDVRDSLGKLVISHDMPNGEELMFSEFLDIYGETGCHGVLAINIKADGLQDELLKILKEKNIENYFIFDTSVPDLIVSLKKGLTCFSRYSEYEPKTALWDECSGVWYDGFNGMVIDQEMVSDLISRGKKVAIVSPELHGRDYESVWEALRSLPPSVFGSDNLILCTDIPESARDYFNGN